MKVKPPSTLQESNQGHDYGPNQPTENPSFFSYVLSRKETFCIGLRLGLIVSRTKVTLTHSLGKSMFTVFRTGY